MASDDSIRSVMGYIKENVLVNNIPQVTMAAFVLMKCKQKKLMSNHFTGKTQVGKRSGVTQKALLKNIW